MFFFHKSLFITFTKDYNNAECKKLFGRDYFMIIKKLGHIHILEFYSGNIATAKISVTVL